MAQNSADLRAVIPKQNFGASLEVSAKLYFGGLAPLFGFFVAVGVLLAQPFKAQPEPNLTASNGVIR
jgi:hypothetical protein